MVNTHFNDDPELDRLKLFADTLGNGEIELHALNPANPIID